LPNTEVLIFTVSESEESISEALAAGARGYLLKTEPTRTVVAAIESLAGHNPFFSPQISERLLTNYVQARAATATNADLLTAREREVMQLLAECHTNKAVSALLGISLKTVETHREAIMRKIEAQSIADVIRYAVRAKIIEP
jgi:DNA-binding NarL/FixJ family response regulator